MVCRSTVRSRWSTATLSPYLITSPLTATAGDCDEVVGTRGSLRSGQALDVRRLPQVLETVAHDAHQSHPGRHRRVPALVDHPVELVGTGGLEIGGGESVHRLVVVDEVLEPVDAHGPDLLGGVPVTDVVSLQW